jgi:hypothetical protein
MWKLIVFLYKCLIGRKPRKPGTPAPEFQAMIQRAKDTGRRVIIEWDEDGYANDVTAKNHEIVQSNCGIVVILNAPPGTIVHEEHHLDRRFRGLEKKELDPFWACHNIPA